MFHNVINLQLRLDDPTEGAGVEGFHEHPLPLMFPAFTVIQAPDDTVRACLFFGARMGRTAPFRHEHAALGEGAELHQRQTLLHTRQYQP